MSISDDYRGYAERCLEMARRAANPPEAETFWAMARVWSRLADDEQRLADLVRDADAGFAGSGGSVDGRRATAFWEADLRLQWT